MEPQQTRLATILATMDVPQVRRDELTISNLRWLARNLPVRNSGHAQFDEAIELLRQLIPDAFRFW